MHSAIVIAYGLSAGYTLAYLIRTGRPGLRSRVRQVVGAALWPAYWLIVHGPATILARVRAMAIQVGTGTERLARRIVRWLWRWTVDLTKASVWLLLITWTGSLPYRYVRNYRVYRRGGLSRRRTIWYAWQLASIEPRKVPAR